MPRRPATCRPIWLLAQGHTAAQVSATMALGERWVHQLLERYNAEGPDALGDLRRRNGRSATILTPAVLDKLRVRLADAPPDGGVWSSGKVAAYLAEQLGLEKVAVQRGWEALRAVGWLLQQHRPRNPKSASDAEAEAFEDPGRFHHHRLHTAFGESRLPNSHSTEASKPASDRGRPSRYF